MQHTLTKLQQRILKRKVKKCILHPYTVSKGASNDILNVWHYPVETTYK